MPRTVTPLTKSKIEQDVRLGKSRIYDQGGLYLEKSPSGSLLWRLKYRIDDREKRLALGRYGEVSIAEARTLRDEARREIARNIDPCRSKAALKQARVGAAKNSFEVVAREWFTLKSAKWVEGHSSKVLRRLETKVFPYIGKRPISDVDTHDLDRIVERILNAGTVETARRTLHSCSSIFRFAVKTRRTAANPTDHCEFSGEGGGDRHLASITDDFGIGRLLLAIESYQGSDVVRAALRLAPLVFVRPGELRGAEWTEVNLAAAEWHIPEERMKMRRPHFVPLSRRAVEILTELQQLTGNGRYVFPGEYHRKRPMSENTVNGALRRMGYSSTQMTGHGFRTMASTQLNARGYNRDFIERQLAHKETDKSRDAYNRAEFFPERRAMMQEWSDILDQLRFSAQRAIKQPSLDIPQ